MLPARQQLASLGSIVQGLLPSVKRGRGGVLSLMLVFRRLPSPALGATGRRWRDIVGCRPPPTPLLLLAARSMAAVAVSEADFPLKEELEERGIVLKSYEPGQKRIVCPRCKGGSSHELCLAILIKPDLANATWTCHRATCGWVGGTGRAEGNGAPVARAAAVKGRAEVLKKALSAKEVEELNLEPLSDEKLLLFFEKRKISEATVRRNEVMQGVSNGTPVIAFSYKKEKQLVNCKFRGTPKRFWQVPGVEKIFYGLDDVKNQDVIVIVEGEMDKLALDEAGIRNCVSVPDGAPPNLSNSDVPPPTQDKKYQYLWNCKDYLDRAKKIVIATDNDEPGQALGEELARRLGREKCWRVKWPFLEEEGRHCKDANDVLYYLGKEALCQLVAEAEEYPIKGLLHFSQFFKEIEDYYYLRLGDERGVSTGWHSLDDIYRVVPGELTVVTGVPNSGKSEWIDALLCNLNMQKGWSFALCSMENKVREHARKLLEKKLQKPFFDAPYANLVSRMSPQDLAMGKAWLNQNFILIRHENDQLPSVSWVLDLAKAAVMRHGIRGLVIDPYNELDHQRPSNQTETEYVSQMLTKVKRFAQHHDCHVWFVAHPKQLQVWRGEAPGLYDISGSAHFINKCDNGIVIHRNRDPDSGPLDQVQVLVKKVRNKAAGTIGDAFLSYNKVTGEYTDSL